jgi:hypothetical protein
MNPKTLQTAGALHATPLLQRPAISNYHYTVAGFPKCIF